MAAAAHHRALHCPVHHRSLPRLRFIHIQWGELLSDVAAFRCSLGRSRDERGSAPANVRR